MSTAGRPAGVIQHGAVGSYPIHAAACRCGAAVYDQPAFEDAALWLRRHLSGVHGIDMVEVDVRRLVHRQSADEAERSDGADEVDEQRLITWLPADDSTADAFGSLGETATPSSPAQLRVIG